MMERIYFASDDNAVAHSLIGYTAYNQDVMLFDYGNVIVRRDYRDVQNVRLLSGGGSGNEPAYAGFVGKGMLTAAVQGNVFQSPSSKEILRTIRELSLEHSAGILIIIQGNSGTVLNFGLAAERAYRERLLVRMVVVNDDFNNDNYSKTKKRGLSGVLLMIKIAGAMCDEGLSINEIYKRCTELEKAICSISVSFKHLTQNVDTCICKKMIVANEIEIGVGINEEPGVKKIKISSQQDVTDSIIKECLRAYGANFDTEVPVFPKPVVVLVNNINGLSQIEENIFVTECVGALKAKNIKIERLYTGNFFSSPTIVGLIVSIMGVCDDNLIKWLDAPSTATAWKQVNQLSEISLDNIVSGKLIRKMDKYVPLIRGPKLPGTHTNCLRVALQFACDALISCERQINLIDSEDGDGDTGTRLKHASQLILNKITAMKIIVDYPATLFECLSKSFESSLGGTLGCIYCILFEAASNYLGQYAETDTVTPELWLGALKASSQALKKYGVVDLGDQTLYDPIEMFARTFQEDFDNKISPMDAFGHAVFVAQESSQKTKSSLSKFADSGAHSVGIWLRAVYEGVKATVPTM